MNLFELASPVLSSRNEDGRGMASFASLYMVNEI